MIKCFEPSLEQRDIDKVLQTLQTKILAFGSNVGDFERRYSEFSNKKYNIGFNSASSAAFLLYQYLYEEHGPCRVYTPSLGFVSPIYAAAKNGHEVIYVDVDKNLLISGDSLEKKFIHDGKKSIVMPILYGGVSELPGIDNFCKNNKCLLVLDSAHCISPNVEHDYAFYSFHPVKPICMSNGGLLSTDHKKSAEYMFSGRNFGRRKINDTYDIVQSGFNFYMNNLNAALGLGQLHSCLRNIEKRRVNFEILKKNIPEDLGYFTHHDHGSSYYLSTLVLKSGHSSAIMRETLRENGVQASVHYPFLHKTSFYGCTTSIPRLDSLEDKIINLPIHQELCPADLERIIDECVRYSRSRRQPQ